MEYMRVWKELDIQKVKDHIIMVDDMLGYCPGCKTIGIELKDLKTCPSCDREFRYVTSQEARGGRFDIVMRMKKKLPDLTFVDYDDYIRVTGQKEAKELFKI
jgi:hypothetical protein